MASKTKPTTSNDTTSTAQTATTEATVNGTAPTTEVMVKPTDKPTSEAAVSPAAKPTDNGPLEALALQLEALQAQAKALGEDLVATKIGYGVRSARYAAKRAAVRNKRVGGLIAQLQAKGLTAEQIIAQLSK